MIDQTFIVLREDAELGGRFLTQVETCDTTSALEMHCAKQLAQQFNPTPGIIFVKLLAYPADIDTSADKLGRDLEGTGRGVGILKGTGVGGDRDVKVLGDLAIERQSFAFDQLE
jgi:hypothetical protein